MGLFGRKNRFEEMMQNPDMAKDYLNGKRGFMSKLLSLMISKEQKALFNYGMDAVMRTQLTATAAQTATYSANAKVLNIEDTHQLIYNNPRVILTLEVTEEGRAPYRYQMDTVVNRIQIPRAGDIIQLGTSTQLPGEFLYMGIIPAV